MGGRNCMRRKKVPHRGSCPWTSSHIGVDYGGDRAIRVI